MLMQPSPTAETSIPLVPNILVCMAGPYRLTAPVATGHTVRALETGHRPQPKRARSRGMTVSAKRARCAVIAAGRSPGGQPQVIRSVTP